jgi:hypothetical protein
MDIFEILISTLISRKIIIVNQRTFILISLIPNKKIHLTLLIKFRIVWERGCGCVFKKIKFFFIKI